MESSSQPHSLVLQLSQHAEEFVIPFPGGVMGRGNQADFSVESAEVSRSHCMFFVKNGLWRVKDLESTNGTTINGCPVTDCILCVGDRVRIGDLEFLVTGPKAPEAAAKRAKEIVESMMRPGPAVAVRRAA